jgi:anti-sigma regulatory factor (Ser/Thr protein kinase)
MGVRQTGSDQRKKKAVETTVDTGGLSGRLAGTPGASADGGTWTLAHRPEAAAHARKITEEVLREWGIAPAVADSVLLLVSELVANVVEHVRPPAALHLRREPGAGRVRVEVTDSGPATRQGDWAASCTDGEHGRGLHIIDLVTAAHGDDQEHDHATHWADLTTAA